MTTTHDGIVVYMSHADPCLACRLQPADTLPPASAGRLVAVPQFLSARFSGAFLPALAIMLTGEKPG